MGNGMNPAIRACLEAGEGVATTAELRAASSWSAVNWAIRTGQVERVLPQVCIAARAERDAALWIRAALAWSRVADACAPYQARATGPSALALWRLPAPRGGIVHLEVPVPSLLRSRRGIVVHRLQVVGTPQRRAGLSVVSCERALVSSWPVLAGAEQRAPFFAARHARTTTTTRLRAELDTWPRLRGRRDLRAFLDLLDDGCESELEYIARTQVFTGPDFARIDWQHWIEHPDGRFRADGYDEATRTALELDGDAHHSTREQRSYDARRTRLLGELGIRVFRFHHDDVMWRPAQCRAQLRAILAAASPGGRPRVTARR